MYRLSIPLIISLGNCILLAQIESKVPAGTSPEDTASPEKRSTYVLGPDDQIVIRALHAEEISRTSLSVYSRMETFVWR